METRQNEEAKRARKARKESKEKQKAEEETVHANVKAAQAAAEAVLKTPFTKQTSSATSRKQRTPTQRLVAGAQGEDLGEVMSPRARDTLISNIAQCVAQEAFATFTPRVTQTQTVIVTSFQSTQTTQAKTTMTMTMTTAMTQSDIIVLGGHCLA